MATSDPALDVVNGDVAASGLTLPAGAGGVAVRLQNGSLRLRGSTVTSASGQPGVLVTGGMLDLGTADAVGGNTLGGPGDFVELQNANDVPVT